MNSTMGLQAVERRADAQAGKAMLGDGGVDHPAVAELLQQALADLVGALIFGDFLAHQEHQLVAAHFLRHGVAQRVAHRLVITISVPAGTSGSAGARPRRSVPGLARSSTLQPFSSPAGASALGAAWRPLLRRGARRLAIGQQGGDGRIDLHAFGAFGHQDLADLAFVHGLEFHRGLVGFDFGQNVAGLDGVAFLHQPFGELALFHGGRQRGHQDLGAHQA